MKKTKLLIFTTLLAVCLSGCGSQKQNGEEIKSETKNTQTIAEGSMEVSGTDAAESEVSGSDDGVEKKVVTYDSHTFDNTGERECAGSTWTEAYLNLIDEVVEEDPEIRFELLTWGHQSCPILAACKDYHSLKFYSYKDGKAFEIGAFELSEDSYFYYNSIYDYTSVKYETEENEFDIIYYSLKDDVISYVCEGHSSKQENLTLINHFIDENGESVEPTRKENSQLFNIEELVYGARLDELKETIASMGPYATWQEAYEALITKHVNSGQKYTYKLIYFNEDDIPELVVDYQDNWFSMFTFKNNTYHYSGTLPGQNEGAFNKVYEKENLLVEFGDQFNLNYPGMIWACDFSQMDENGDLKLYQKYVVEYARDTTLWDFPEELDFSDPDIIIEKRDEETWEHTEISQEEFEAAREQAGDENEAYSGVPADEILLEIRK